MFQKVEGSVSAFTLLLKPPSLKATLPFAVQAVLPAAVQEDVPY